MCASTSRWRRRDQRGISEIVGTILMVGVVGVAMMFVAYVVLSGRSAPELFVSFKVEVENSRTGTNPDDFTEVKLTITHTGVDIIPNPAKYLGVWGHEDGAAVPDNLAYEKDGYNGFSYYSTYYGEFKLGDNAVLFVRHDDADVRPGDYFRVRIYDNYSEKVQYDKVLQVKFGYG